MRVFIQPLIQETGDQGSISVLYILLLHLQVEVENVILRMAAEFRDRQDQLVFLINNYDLMLSVMQCRFSETNKEVRKVGERSGTQPETDVEGQTRHLRIKICM